MEANTRRRIEVLRKMEDRHSRIPNLSAKLQATRLLDDVEGKEAINLLTRGRKNGPTDEPPLQQDGLVIVGNDVESLFPSLRAVETARMARIALMKSDLRTLMFKQP